MDVSESEKNEDKDKQAIDAIKGNLPISNKNSVRTDADLWENDKQSLTKHNKQYSELLEAYVDSTKKLLTFKYLKKHSVFNVSIALFIVTPIVMVLIIICCLIITVYNEELSVLEVLPEIVAAFGSLIATYITIFKLITEYLFNKSEETSMENIITKIQEYDMHLRGNKSEK